MAAEALTDARGVYERLDDVQILDVREPYEWETGRVDGSIHLPLNTLMAGGEPDLDRDRPVVVVCRTGSRSELATLMLQARGFDAHNLEGGLEDWAREGLPLATPDGRPGTVA
jgi:rhodanese-related sulfurtransferase